MKVQKVINLPKIGMFQFKRKIIALHSLSFKQIVG